MNKTLRNALIAVVTILAIILVLPFLVPVDTYRDRIESAAARATGRALHIEGPLRLMLFPQFGLRAEKVTFANMPGGHAAAMASVGDIKLAIHFLPLLTGRVELAQIVLEHPVIELEVNAEGRSNWKFGKNKNAGSGGGSVTLPANTEFSGIKIDDGRISYTNDKTGTHRALDHVNASVAITRLDQPLAIDGNLFQNGHRVDFDVKIATLKTLLGDGTTALDLSLTSDMMQAGFKGGLGQDGALAGALKFDTASLRGVIGWLGEKLPAGGGLGRTSLESYVASKDKVTTLSGMRLLLDHSNMTGTLAIDSRGEVPSLTGALSIDRLDLNPYLAAPTHGRPAQKVDTGWSRTPINLALLNRADAQLTLAVGALRLRNLRLGKTVASVTLAGGALTTRLDPITLYGGSGRAELDVDGRGGVPAFRNTLRFERVSLAPLLNDAMGVNRIEGTGSLILNVAAQGTSANAVMHTLSGNGSLVGDHGRIRGVDLGAVARTIQMALGGGATGTSANSYYLAMGGSFGIVGGVLSNKDFRISGPVLSMTGAGAIDIGNRNIDFRLMPKAALGGSSIGIPFRVKGSWDHVHYAPDLSGVVNGVIQNLQSGRAPFKGLFGGGSKTQGGPKKKKKSVGDVLKNMFGIH
ncbi:MAG: AsmA family protein [Rhizomicrobium sp.]|jgi:AsmA protein